LNPSRRRCASLNPRFFATEMFFSNLLFHASIDSATDEQSWGESAKVGDCEKFE
jgi:hypothetical protein